MAFLAAGAVWSQAVPAQPDAHPAYEAAVIKPNVSSTNNSQSHGSRGQIVFINQTLKRLIERAYGFKPFQVTGPDWMDNVRFDITAKYPPDTKDDDRALMLRSLLEDRFKLATHHESKDLPGYALVVAKRFKLQPVESAGGSDMNSNGGRIRTLTVKRTSLASLADFIARTLGEMVVDKTGIEGAYDFELRFTTDDQIASGTDAETAPSLFTALQETLGLRLQAQKVPVDLVVVDHVEKVPTEN
jgi:uncharacterized protein (TIGR03435 family)